jgi:arylsulfatase A-like enzyme
MLSGSFFGLLGYATLKISQKKYGALVLSLVFLVPFLIAQTLLTSGAWIQQQWWRWPASLLLLCIEGFLVFFALRFFAETQASLSVLRHRRWPLVALFFAGSFLFATLDRFLFPGLYVPFHIGSSIAAIACASFAGVYCFQTSRRSFFRWLSPLIFLVLLPAGFWLRQSPAAWRAVSKSPGVGKAFSALAVKLGLGPKLPTGTASDIPPLVWPDGTARPNLEGADVVLITIDALRPDRLGAYGSKKQISPNLDALAKKSVVFTRAYSPSPTSSYSLSALFCSRYSFGQMPETPANWPTLAQHFAENGYQTYATYNEGIFFTDKERFTSFAENGFGFQEKYVEYLDSYDISRLGLAALDEDPGPNFVWLHIAEPHEPYQVRPGFDRGPTPEDRYDAEVWYADKHLEQILKPLEGRNVIIIVAADHGEAFGEHGVYYHTSDIYSEQAHIPLFIYYPGIQPRIIDTPQTLIDLAPTVLELLGLPPLEGAQGRSFAPLLVGQKPDDMPVFSEWKNRRAIAVGGYRLICDMMTNSCELFDIVSDVEERQDISAQKPEVAAKLAGQLNAFLASQDKHKDEVAWPDPLERLARHDLTQVKLAIPYVFDPDPKTRAHTAKLLGDAKAIEAKEALVQALKDESSEVKLAAALSLAALQDNRAVAALKGFLQDERDPERRAALLVALASLQAISCEELAEVIDSKNTELARQAIALIVAKRERTLLIIERLQDALGVGPLTECAADALSVLQAKEAVPALIDALQQTTQIPARTAIVKALGILGDSSALSVLTERGAFGEGGDHVGWALLQIGAEAPFNGAGGVAKKLLNQADGWVCNEDCSMQTEEASLSFTLPQTLADRPYTLLLYAQGKGSLRVSSGAMSASVSLPASFTDLRIPLPKELLIPGSTLVFHLRAPEGLHLSLAMILPIPDDISTYFKE